MKKSPEEQSAELNNLYKMKKEVKETINKTLDKIAELSKDGKYSGPGGAIELTDWLKDKLRSEEWKPYRADASSIIQTELEKGRPEMREIGKTKEDDYLSAVAGIALLVKFEDFNDHLVSVIEKQKNKVYKKETSFWSFSHFSSIFTRPQQDDFVKQEVDNLIRKIKGHESFKDLNESVKVDISSFLETKSPRMEEIIKQQRSHADKGVISSLWDNFLQLLRSQIAPRTTPQSPQERLEDFRKQVIRKEEEIIDAAKPKPKL